MMLPGATASLLFDRLRHNVHAEGSLASTAELVETANGAPLGTALFECICASVTSGNLPAHCQGLQGCLNRPYVACAT